MKGMVMMRYGVNYIPSKNWLYSWLDWDAAKVKEDLYAIKELGCDHIRAHLLWSCFQENETRLSPLCMKNLASFVSICEEVGIDFFLTLFTGWMSGFVFLPSWIQPMNACARGMFTDADLIEAEKFYIREISGCVGSSERFLGFDLGNELNILTHERLDAKITLTAADCWADTLLQFCDEVAPGKLHNNGVDHQPWFYKRGFSRENLANSGAVTTLHAWVEFTQANQHYDILGTGCLHLAPYMAELAKAYAEDYQRPIWVQEFGMSDLWLRGGATTEEFLIRTLDNISTVENIWGVTWWCSHDIDEKFLGFAPLEYHLGMLDVNNHAKPYAKKFAAYIKEQTGVQPQKRTAAMIFEPNSDEPWFNAKRYMEFVEQGIQPAIILPKQAQQKDYLAARGIATIL